MTKIEEKKTSKVTDTFAATQGQCSAILTGQMNNICALCAIVVCNSKWRAPGRTIDNITTARAAQRNMNIAAGASGGRGFHHCKWSCA
jgi:hypothetical protein